MNSKINFDHISVSPTNSVHTTSHSPCLESWWRKGWTYFVRHFTRENEPHVWLRRSITGNILYYVYDPHTGRSAYLSSEADVQSWLEQLRYQGQIR